MKKKIVIGLSIFSLIFLFGGIYIITSIEKTTSKLDNLIKLHQVEILREHLLIQIKKVQTDLSLKGTHYARGIDTVVTDVRGMEKTADACFGCHHSEEVTERLVDLKKQIGKYEEVLSRVLTISANANRLNSEEDVAFRAGEELVKKLNNMIALTSRKLSEKTDDALRKIANTKITLFILVVIGPFLTAGLAAVFIKGFTTPIGILLNATRRLKGDLDYRIEGLKDEFGELAESFNDMAFSIKNMCNEMQRTEQIAVVGQLAGGLAHEIKNPLAGIKASMEVLTEQSSLAEEDRDTLLKVIAEIRRIEMLIKDLLNFARPPKPQLVEVHVNKILDSVIAMLTFSLKTPSSASNNSKPVRMEKCFDDCLPSIMADPMQLQQVFLNLLLNAADAMSEGGTIGVKTFHNSEDRYIHIDISDTGKGIDEGIHYKIFQPFFTTKAKGTGLGLAITKRLIEQHGGAIDFWNNTDGGVTFSVVLPVMRGEMQRA